MLIDIETIKIGGVIMYVENKDKIGARLRYLREKSGFSMVQMADILNVSSNAVINNWEKGNKNISIKYMKKYADYFNVSIDWLKYGDFSQYLYNTVINEVLKGSELTDSAVEFYEYNYDYPKEIDKEKDFEEDDDITALKNGYSYDYCDLARDICDVFLFGYSSNKIDDYIDEKNSFYVEYEEYMEQIGYNGELIIYNTVDLFKKNLKPLEDAYNIKEDNKIDRESMKNIGLDDNIIDKIYPLIDRRELYNISYPNILKIQNELLRYQKNHTDLDDGITNAILKLLK